MPVLVRRLRRVHAQAIVWATLGILGILGSLTSCAGGDDPGGSAPFARTLGNIGAEAEFHATSGYGNVTVVEDPSIGDVACAHFGTGNGRFVIRVNPTVMGTLPPAVQDFFLYHEFGHIYLEHLLVSEPDRRRAEYLADAYGVRLQAHYASASEASLTVQYFGATGVPPSPMHPSHAARALYAAEVLAAFAASPAQVPLPPPTEGILAIRNVTSVRVRAWVEGAPVADLDADEVALRAVFGDVVLGDSYGVELRDFFTSDLLLEGTATVFAPGTTWWPSTLGGLRWVEARSRSSSLRCQREPPATLHVASPHIPHPEPPVSISRLARLLPIGGLATPTVADLDGDGFDDLVFVDAADPFSLQWMRSSAAATFDPPEIVYSIVPGFDSVNGFDVIDINGDGALDLLPRLGFGPTPMISLNNGNGTFAPAFQYTGSLPAGGALYFGDIDGDQTIDLVMGSPGALAWAHGVGDGTFDDRQDLLVSPGAVSGLALVDIDGDGMLDIVGATATFLSPALILRGLEFAENHTFRALGTSFCEPAVPNATGLAGVTTAVGSPRVALDRVTLTAAGLPAGAFGYFITSQTQSVTTNVPGSIGTLCLGGVVGRFAQPAQIGVANAAGVFALDLDLQAFPSPGVGMAPVQPGDSWTFQAWHRDVAGGAPTSNFTAALEIEFQ